MAQVNKIDSNVTGLRFAEEASFKTLPGSPVWYPLEPNSYADFGGNVTTIARAPLDPSRQRKKGTLVDLDASGGFNIDMTQTNIQDLLQGFMFASHRTKVEFGGSSEITGVVTSSDDYQAASGLDAFAAGDLVFASNFTNSANNGLHVVSAASGTALTVSENLVDETPGATAKLVQVGFQFGSGELEVDVSGDLPILNRASGTKDFTDFGLLPGEWIFVGGDTAGTQFANSNNNGFARVRSVSSTAITLDKAAATLTTDAGGSKTIQIFFGRVLKNEATTSNQVRRTYNLERSLGAPDDGSSDIQYEYLTGSIPNELQLNVNTADKVTADLSFVAADHETRDSGTGAKSGSRPSLTSEDAYNTSSDVTRIKMSSVSSTNENVTALFAYVTDMTLTVNNNVSPNKAIGTLGAFDGSAGSFDVGGSLTAYFGNVSSIDAVRNNTDITLDMHIVNNNVGVSFDIPLIALGEGRANIEKDQPITLPLGMLAADGSKITSSLNHTLLLVFWDYLPTAADS